MGDKQLTEAQQAIAEVCDKIKESLIEKNRKYGNSALDPIRVFSKATPEEQILVRMDDKLSRIKNRQNDDDEDPFLDLVGYLVLYLAQQEIKHGK